MSRWLEVAQKHFDGSQPVRQNNRRSQDHKHIRFASHSLEHFFIHDVEDSCDGSNQFKDGSPISFRLMLTWMLCTRETSWQARRGRLPWHFLCVFKPGKVLSVTVQPKAGRWKKQAYFAKPVYILWPSSLGLDGGGMQCTRPGGWMNPAHETSSFRCK